jgi:FMN phosphatase YigB (HAD superfamily)
MPKPIIFCDFHGVLSYNHYWTQIQNPNHKLYQLNPKLRELYTDELCVDWMRGNNTSENVNSYFSKTLGIPYNELFGIFANDCCNIDISRPIINLLQKLRKEYMLVLITDNMDSFDRFTLPNNLFLEESFDHISNSYKTKLLKTDDKGKVFVDICRNYQSDVKDCFLIDDSDYKCQVFSNLGGTAICQYGESNIINHLRHAFLSQTQNL